MINANVAAGMAATVAAGREGPGALVEATVARGPDKAGSLTLRLDGGREVQLQIASGAPKLTAGQSVLYRPSDGTIFVPGPAQPQQPAQAQQAQQTQLAGQAQLSTQTQPPLVQGQAVSGGPPQEHLRDKFESPLLRSIPASVWEQIISERGGKVDAEALKALDAALRNRSIPIDPSSAVQMERIGQWLRVVLDNPHLIEDLAERIPTSGAKDIAGLMELIGQIGAGVLPKDAPAGISPEQFFVTADKILGGGLSVDKLLALGIDKNLIAALTANAGNVGVGANGGAALLEILLKSTFSAAPSALLDLMKQVSAKNATGFSQLPPAEAQKIVSSIVNTLPAQGAVRPETLHDARQISTQNLAADISAPQKSSVQSAIVPQIKAEYSGLTESAIQLLLGSDNKKGAAAVSERIHALGKLVERIPVTEGGRGDVSVRDNRVNVFGGDNRANISAGDNRGNISAGDSRANVPAGDNRINAAAVDRAAVAADKTFVAGITGGRGQPPAQGIDTSAITNRSPVSTSEMRANIPVDNRQHTIAAERAAVVNTPAADRLQAADRSQVADRSQFADKSQIADRPPASTPLLRADNTAKPVDVQAIRIDSLKIVDNLKAAAEPILRGIERSGGIDIGDKTRLLGIVREAVSTLDNTLRPLAREGRPVPPEFYDRVTSSAKHQINTDTKNEMFTRINTAQEQIRGIIDAVRAGSIQTDKGAATIINTPARQLYLDKPAQNIINTSTQPQQVFMDKSPQNTANPPTQPQQLSLDKSAQNTVNISTQPQQQLYGDKSVQNTINTSAQPQQLSDGKSAQNTINTATQQPQQLSADKSVQNTINTSTQQQPLSADKPAQQSPPDSFLKIAERMWANTEKIRAGFQEAFSSLDLPNRISPLDSQADKSAPHAIRQSIDALRTEMLLDVSRALREVFSSVEELRNLVSQLSEKLKMPPEFEKALLRATQELEQQARQSGAEVNDRLKDILKDLSRLQSDAMRARESGIESSMRQSPSDFIRSAITGAAKGLENLQLLASQTRGAELQQQVLALPVKIGEEWNEVHIKFVKEKRDGEEKKKAGGGHVSIYINVAPSKLGSVTAHLDYHPPSSLKLSLQFENPKATKWFREQSGELRAALSEAGLPGTALEFHTKRAAAVRAEKAAVPAAGAADTVKDTSAGVIGHDGKVDFKV
ncbi:MAG: hypothetical protein FWB85_09330 [Chitinispirillia bacterium]|nr:hypothetical protein [Chitinispirillia bacterium]MCL2241203.1 hypothetical protein [Chitinispirillia bacterium]